MQRENNRKLERRAKPETKEEARSVLMLYKGGLWDGCLTWTGGFACVGGSYVVMNSGESLDMFSAFKNLCVLNQLKRYYLISYI